VAASPDAVPVRPAWYEGRYSRWLTSTDHKAVGALTICTSFVFLVLAVIASLIMRARTAAPPGGYDEVFTMHLAAAASLVLVPLALGLALYVVPLQIGARGIVAPQLAAFFYWLWALGGVTLVLTFYEAGTGSCGWSCSGPLTSTTGHTGDLWLLSLAVMAAAQLGTSAILLATLATRAAPGMTPALRPPFARASGAFATLLIPLAVLTIVESILLLLARHGSLSPSVDTVRHLSWAYGWPELALLLAPAGSIVVEVWRIARPLTATLLATGAFLSLFVAAGGGLILTAFDGQRFGVHFALTVAAYGALTFVVLALLAGLVYWWPKLFGRILGDDLGVPAAWLAVLGANIVGFPAYLASDTRVYMYPHFSSWDLYARVSMLGAATFTAGLLVFLADALRKGARADNDPWRADTLEWLTTSPPPPGNFERIPAITSSRPLRDLRARTAS